MTERRHSYRTHLTWLGAGGRPFQRHQRRYLIEAAGKPPIEGSSDSAFRGDAALWSPEDLLVASLSACHQLWYLGLCAAAGLTVTAYEDDAEGLMVEDSPGGPGRFAEVILRPKVTLAAGGDAALAMSLHSQAHASCFIARSVNFPVRHVAAVGAEP